MVRFAGEFAGPGSELGSGLSAGYNLGRRRSSVRRGSESGDNIQHTIALTSVSSTPSAHETVVDTSTGDQL